MRLSLLTRRQFLAALLIVLPAIALRADEPKIASANVTAIAGQRIFYTGHSFHMFVPAMIDQIVKTTDIQGHPALGPGRRQEQGEAGLD